MELHEAVIIIKDKNQGKYIQLPAFTINCMKALRAIQNKNKTDRKKTEAMYSEAYMGR